jgi:hypothetical protein
MEVSTAYEALTNICVEKLKINTKNLLQGNWTEVYSQDLHVRNRNDVHTDVTFRLPKKIQLCN